jgi:hypothetical protein
LHCSANRFSRSLIACPNGSGANTFLTYYRHYGTFAVSPLAPGSCPSCLSTCPAMNLSASGGHPVDSAACVRGSALQAPAPISGARCAHPRLPAPVPGHDHGPLDVLIARLSRTPGRRDSVDGFPPLTFHLPTPEAQEGAALIPPRLPGRIPEA